MVGPFFLDQFSLILDEFARAGGGGSGGGSGSGEGGVLAIIGAIGYAPMYGLARLLRLGQYNKPVWLLLQVAGWVIAGLIAAALVVASVITGSFTAGFYFFFPIAVGAVLGMGSGLYSWFSKLKQSKKVISALRAAEKSDYNWNEKKLQSYTEGIFYKFQKDWSEFNTESMGRYLSPNYQNHINLMLHALNGAHRVNKMLNVKIKKSMIVAVTDSDDNDQDTFLIGVSAHANDQLIDTRSGKMLYQDKNVFTEYWRFIRRGNDWLLDGVEQSTNNYSKTRTDIQTFARQNNMYYSPDWGWLLLPADGYLFSNGKFGVSDINNHTIGFVNNVLTQAYTYEPIHVKNTVSADQYLVMQTNVPKSYGRILVKRRSRFINWPVAGLKKIQMEWGEFNAMYDVYASDMEKVTSFELLNPAFMAHLRDLPFEVNIEVVDSIVYIFTKASADISTYKALYDILLKAHKEMKL